MKCKNCGAQMGLDVEKCPYCGSENKIAKTRSSTLDKLKKYNEKLSQEELKKTRAWRFYKLHKRINIIMTAVVIVLLVVSFIFYMLSDNSVSKPKGSVNTVKELYNKGDYEELHTYMHEHGMFGEEGLYEYSQMALLWYEYHKTRLDFIKAYDNYMLDDQYNKMYLERCVDDGYGVLTCHISSYYNEVSEENANRIKPYQDEIYMLFTGILNIPEEMLSDLDEYDYKKEDVLKEYVLEVLPNE
ncbi:MAG: hypothetical protein ACI4GD_12600 [Lachnospiraceae bacterium]